MILQQKNPDQPASLHSMNWAFQFVNTFCSSQLQSVSGQRRPDQTAQMQSLNSIISVRVCDMTLFLWHSSFTIWDRNYNFNVIRWLSMNKLWVIVDDAPGSEKITLSMLCNDFSRRHVVLFLIFHYENMPIQIY